MVLLDWIKANVVSPLDLYKNILLYSSVKSAILMAVVMALFIPLTRHDGLMILFVFFLLLMMLRLNNEHFPHTNVILALWIILLTAGSTTLYFSDVFDMQWLILFVLSLAGSGIQIYQLWIYHCKLRSAADAASTVYRFVDLMPEPTLQDKEELMHPVRNNLLYDEFRTGMYGKSKEEQDSYWMKFYVKYHVITTRACQRY